MEKATRQSGFEAHQSDVPLVVAAPVSESRNGTQTRSKRLVSSTRRLLTKAAIDRAVIYGVLSLVKSLISGPVTVWLIANHFTPELQGFYYTFASLMALQVFVDLGLGTVIIQFASHEWAELRLDEHGNLTGSPSALSRLASLGQVAFRWYAVAGVIVALGLTLWGYYFFSQAAHPNIPWAAPWVALCVVTGLNVCLVPAWSLLEGCNQVTRVYGFRLIQGLFITVALWLAIAFDAGLWTGTIATLIGLSYGAVFLKRRYGTFFKQVLSTAPSVRISWRFELWPLQWKIALSWLSGYFIFSLFTPILFYYQGAVVAGQMGMTWTLVSMLSGVSTTWSMSKAPQFGLLIAKREYAVLDRLFYRLTIASFLIAILGAVVIWTGLYLLNVFNFPVAGRFLPPLPTGIFLLATVLLQPTYPQSFYLRAHKREPFLVTSVASGVAIGLSNWILGSRFSATGMAIGYLVVVIVFLPICTLIWYRCRKAWHSDVNIRPMTPREA